MHFAIIQLFSANENDSKLDFISTLVDEMKLVTQKNKGPSAAASQPQ